MLLGFPSPPSQAQLSGVCGGVSPVPPVLSLSRSIKRRRTHAGRLKSPPTLPYGWWAGRCSNHTAPSRQEEHPSHLLLYPRHWSPSQPPGSVSTVWSFICGVAWIILQTIVLHLRVFLLLLFEHSLDYRLMRLALASVHVFPWMDCKTDASTGGKNHSNRWWEPKSRNGLVLFSLSDAAHTSATDL